jgi:hypothetical protein
MPGLTRQQLFGAVLGLLAELALASPVLLILEDLHWADGSTRDLVTFLSRVLHRERLAIVATYRTDDLHRQHPLRQVITELLRLPSVTSVGLGPLDPAAMAEHLGALAGHGPPGGQRSGGGRPGSAGRSCRAAGGQDGTAAGYGAAGTAGGSGQRAAGGRRAGQAGIRTGRAGV